MKLQLSYEIVFGYVQRLQIVHLIPLKTICAFVFQYGESSEEGSRWSDVTAVGYWCPVRGLGRSLCCCTWISIEDIIRPYICPCISGCCGASWCSSASDCSGVRCFDDINQVTLWHDGRNLQVDCHAKRREQHHSHRCQPITTVSCLLTCLTTCLLTTSYPLPTCYCIFIFL